MKTYGKRPDFRISGLSVIVFILAFFAWPAKNACAVITGGNPVIEDLDIQASLSDRGILSVEETLTVLFDGEPLRQDLTRGISGHYAKSGREKSKTGFVLLNATLDGQPAQTTIRRGAESLRLTLAPKGGVFRSGLHVFKLKYELTNMVVPHPEQDTMIWRVVRESSCRVTRIRVRVSLPGDTPFRLMSGELSNLKEGAGLDTDTSGLLVTTTPLPENRSLTVYMAWDKGLVTDRTEAHPEWRVWDIGVLIALLCYYIFIWLRYGRLPAPGTPVPETNPPDGLSPGLLRSLKKMETDARALTAEILNLAVGGFIHIDSFTAGDRGPEQGKARPGSKKHHYSSLERMMERKYRLRRLPQDGNLVPSPTENLLLHNLFPKDEKELVLDQSSTDRIRRTWRALSRIFSESGSRFLFQHMNLWFLGVFFFEAYTAFVMFSVLSQGVGGIEPDSEHALAFMAPLFFLAPFLGGEKIWKRSTFVFIVRTCIPLFFCACALAILRQQDSGLGSIAALVGCIAVIGVFWKLAPIRSEEGVRLLNETEGFRMGLGSHAELKEDDSIEKFERLFPYAFALNKEQPLIARYDPLITRLRHHAQWHTADTHSFSGGAEYFSLAYELGETIQSILRK